MRSKLMGLVVASAGFAMLVTPAAATEYQDEMREMREMVLKLQDQVESQQGQIDEQQGVIREAGIDDERGSWSGLSSFLESTDFSGWVAASYFWNFANPKENTAGDNGPFSNPHHQDHNSFQFDEAWFTIDRSATEESPAGFHVEVVYGKTAQPFSVLTSGTGTGNDNGNDLWIPQANVSYMTPWGQTITAGKFATTVGYEVVGAPSNVNITRGFTWNLFQPVSHVGVTVSQEFDMGVRYTLGVVNGFGTDQEDVNEGKGFMWQVGWGNDMVTLLFNGLYEQDIAGPGDERYVLDFIGEVTPADNLLFWANLDYMVTNAGSSQGSSDDNPRGVGLAIGGRVGITDDLGFGARGEYAWFDRDSAARGVFLDDELWSATATIDYALTDNLTWKIETKYEEGDGSNRDMFQIGQGPEDRSDTWLLGTQLYYQF